MALQAYNPSTGETEATGSGAQSHASLHNESPMGKHTVQTPLRQRCNWEHVQITAGGSPSFTSFSTCLVSVSSITSLHIAVCCFQENLHRKKFVTEDNYHKPGGKNIAFYSAFSEGKIPLAKTNKSQKMQNPPCSQDLDASSVFLRSPAPILKSDRWAYFYKPYCPQMSPWILHQIPAGLDYKTIKGESETDRLLSQAPKLSLKNLWSANPAPGRIKLCRLCGCFLISIFRNDYSTY